MISCNVENSRQKSLGESKSLNQVFNKKEISDLYKILTFFDNQIMNSFKSESLIESYNMFNAKDLEFEKDGLIFGNIPFSKQKYIYHSIDKSTFNEVWRLGKSIEGNGKELSIVFINPNGKYANYLQLLGAKNNFIKNYSKVIEETGDIPPTLLYSITHNYKDLNISDENIRLVIAIHYLTLNDNLHNGGNR